MPREVEAKETTDEPRLERIVRPPITQPLQVVKSGRAESGPRPVRDNDPHSTPCNSPCPLFRARVSGARRGTSERESEDDRTGGPSGIPEVS